MHQMNNKLDVDVIPALRAADVDHVKLKVIELYLRYLKRLNKGYQDDYSNILNMISFIGMPRNPEQDRKIFEYLINVRP